MTELWANTGIAARAAQRVSEDRGLHSAKRRGAPCWYSCRVNAARVVWSRLGILILIITTLGLSIGGNARAQTVPVDDASSSRPRVGLVLSGGGARGAAHIGVLKVLEELRVPIDAIAGTSMGAVVGGLYASGLSAREIESVMTSVNWQEAFRDRPPRKDITFRRKQEDQNFLVKFPLGLRGGRFLLPRGLIQGQTLSQMLRRLTLPVAHIDDFDDLPTPFRALATDLATGEAVVIGEGDLTSAMRASLSAPGVFAPVERDGRILVDGGIAANLPVDVARSMGVDVLIVVDVGFPLQPREKLNSVPVISNQMLAILIRRESERQRASLTDRDVIIDPPLGDASSFDFSIVQRAIDAGEQAALGVRDRLASLALDPVEHERYVALRAERRRNPPAPRIDFVRVQSGSERYEKQLRERFSSFIGKELDAEQLTRNVTDFYGEGTLEALDYQVVEEDGRYGLALTARRNSWGPNYVRFGLNLQDDFQGNSRYNAATRFILSEITKPGGEWVWDLQVGETSRIATEIYLPLGVGSPWFVMPHAETRRRNVSLLDGQHSLAEYRVRSTNYGIDFGRVFGNWGEIRVGVLREEGSSRVRVGDPSLPVTHFDAREFFVRLSYDELDDVNFPRYGQLATLEWRGESTTLGSDRSSDRLIFDWLAARSWGRNTAVFWTSAGTSLDDDVTDVRTLFPLGGFFNLSGLRPDSLTGPHFGIARLLAYRQIGRAGPGFLDVPTYLGFSYEMGNVWERRSDASFGSLRNNASLFLGLDTLIGPVYVAAGFEEGGEEAFYLFLGRTF